jgi:L-lysine 6-transaminase
MWAHQHFATSNCTNGCSCGADLSAKPDIISFGKKTQVCGVAASTRFDEVEGNVFRESSRINSTFGGNLTDMIRFKIILEVIREENLVENAGVKGDYLLKKLQELAEEFPGFVTNPRGVGLFSIILPHA